MIAAKFPSMWLNDSRNYDIAFLLFYFIASAYRARTTNQSRIVSRLLRIH